jgi:hypothetical protein
MSTGSLWRHLKIAGLVDIWGVSSLSIRPHLKLATHPVPSQSRTLLAKGQ